MPMLRHYLKTSLYTLVLGVLCLLSLEGVARLDQIENHTVVPSIGTQNNYVDIQFANLNKFMETHAKLDCIFVGTSLVVQDFNPEIVGQAYAHETGETLTCYNFGLPNTRMATVGYLTDYLLKKYQPRYIIVGISIISFKRSTDSDTALQNGDWFTVVKGNPNWRGRLIEYSQAYRYYLRFKSWLDPEFVANLDFIQSLQNEFAASGHWASLKTIWDVTQPVEPNTAVPLVYPLTEEVAGLDHIINLTARHPQTQIILVNMPLSDNYIQVNLGFHERYTQLVAELIAPTELIYFDMAQVDDLPNELWRDNAHLNANGALWFSYWFGQTFAEWQSTQNPRPSPQFNQQVVPPLTELRQASGYTCASVTGYSADDRLLNPEALLYNPNLADKAGVEYYEDNIRTFLCITEMTANQRAATYQIWSLLDTMQFADELTLSTSAQTALNQWNLTYRPQDLKTAGIDYLIFKEGWLNGLPTLAQAQLNDPTQYRQIRYFSSPAVGPFYFVIEPIIE